MKTTLLKTGILIVTLLFVSLINSQNVNIPDYEFKNVLLSYSPSIDTNNDNQISVAEAAAVTTLTITNHQEFLFNDPMDPFGGGFIQGISDFTGIDGSVMLVDAMHIDTITLAEFPPLLEADEDDIFIAQVATVDVLTNDVFCDMGTYAPIVIPASVTNGSASTNVGRQSVCVCPCTVLCVGSKQL